MTSFVHVDIPANHPGVVRAEAVIDHVRTARRGFDGARGLAALLLAAIVSSLLIVADRLMATSQEGGLMAVWLVLWGVAFVGLALFAGTARSLANRAVVVARNGARRRAAARADAKFLAYAQHDPRILRDLQVIATRNEVVEPIAAAAAPAAPRRQMKDKNGVPSLHQAMRLVNLGQHY